MCWCDPTWTLEPVRGITFGWIKYDFTDGPGVKCSARHRLKCNSASHFSTSEAALTSSRHRCWRALLVPSVSPEGPLRLRLSVNSVAPGSWSSISGLITLLFSRHRSYFAVEGTQTEFRSLAFPRWLTQFCSRLKLPGCCIMPGILWSASLRETMALSRDHCFFRGDYVCQPQSLISTWQVCLLSLFPVVFNYRANLWAPCSQFLFLKVRFG